MLLLNRIDLGVKDFDGFCGLQAVIFVYKDFQQVLNNWRKFGLTISPLRRQRKPCSRPAILHLRHYPCTCSSNFSFAGYIKCIRILVPQGISYSIPTTIGSPFRHTLPDHSKHEVGMLAKVFPDILLPMRRSTCSFWSKTFNASSALCQTFQSIINHHRRYELICLNYGEE